MEHLSPPTLEMTLSKHLVLQLRWPGRANYGPQAKMEKKRQKGERSSRKLVDSWVTADFLLFLPPIFPGGLNPILRLFFLHFGPRPKNSGWHKPCFWQTMFLSLVKRGCFDENGKNDEFTSFLLKTRVSLLKPPKTTKMTEITQASVA